jgi:hypothetical protein
MVFLDRYYTVQYKVQSISGPSLFLNFNYVLIEPRFFSGEGFCAEQFAPLLDHVEQE